MPFSREPSTTAAGALRCLNRSERSSSASAPSPFDLHHDHVRPALRRRSRARPRPRLLRPASPSSPRAGPARARPHGLELARAPVQERPRLAGGDGLDPARARADRALARGSRTAPISAVERTCVPPQSSREKPSISTTRTSSPYFSPKSIIAPSLRASSIGVTNVRTGIASKTFSLTIRSTRSRSSARERLRMREVEAQLVGPHRRARLLHVVAEHLAQRRVQQVRRRVVRHRREAHRPRRRRARTRSPAAKPSPARRRAPGRRRSGSPRRTSSRRRSPRGSSSPASVTWPPPAGIERRLARASRRKRPSPSSADAELRQHVGLLVADELAAEAGARAKSAARCRSLFSPPAREISRCSSISSRKPSTSTGWPRSSASSDGQLDREPVRRRERERLLGADRVLAGELLEHLQPARERLAEPLLLELDDALDLGGVLAQLRVRVAHLLDDDGREPVDAVEPDPLRRAGRRGGSCAGRCSRGPRSTA